MSRFKLASVLAVLAGPFILVMNYQETAEKKKIDREGIETVAVPTAKIDQRGRKGGHTYKLDVMYPVQGGTTQNARVEVSKALYDKIESTPALPVKYLKDSPAKLVVVGEPLESPEMYYVGFGVLAFGLIGSWWHFGRKQSAPASKEPAPVS